MKDFESLRELAEWACDKASGPAAARLMCDTIKRNKDMLDRFMDSVIYGACQNYATAIEHERRQRIKRDVIRQPETPMKDRHRFTEEAGAVAAACVLDCEVNGKKLGDWIGNDLLPVGEREICRGYGSLKSGRLWVALARMAGNSTVKKAVSPQKANLLCQHIEMHLAVESGAAA